MLTIDYKNGDVEKYQAVRIYCLSGEQKFATGDVVKDFSDALDLIPDGTVSMSSSVDHFLMDDKKDIYYWDEFDGKIKRTSEKQENEKKNKVEAVKQMKAEVKRLRAEIRYIQSELKGLENE